MLLDPTPGRRETPAARADILIVDDLPENRVAFRTLLDDLHQNLILVRSGREALSAVLRHDFAVILLDVNMPDIDGLETASLIRQNRRSAHTPIIFITAFADEIQTQRGYSLGAVDYILSPVVPEVLRSKVKVFVDLHIMQQRLRYQADERVALAAAESARQSAEESAARLKFLLRASKALAKSLDGEKGARELLELMVPEYAGFAAIALLSDTKDPFRVLKRMDRTDGSGPDGERLRSDFHGRVKTSVARAIDSRQRVELGTEELRHLLGEKVSQALRLRTGQIVPLMAGERPLGALMAASASDSPDWLMLEELASRAAVALENAYLYQRLEAEITERRQIERELQDANARKDEFLAMLSHELRNPLTPISAAVEIIRQVAPDDPQLAWATDVTARQLNHLVYLVDELLDAARISRGKIVLRTELVNLLEVVEQGIETVRPLIDARGHTLTQSLPDTPIWLRGDFARLSQVVSNLLNNAAKYTEDGGHIHLELRFEQDEALIVVRDDGIGIEQDLLPSVFELFKQGRRSLDRRQGGLGIGLTVVKRLIELHRGTIDAWSAGAGKGAEFRVRLPCLTEVSRQAEAGDVYSGRFRSGGCRILVVDDNKDGADAIGIFLRLNGHEVMEVGDGMQALECLQAYAPDVVILDIGLPLLDGYEVARRIRLQPENKHILLIALTGYGQKWEQRQGMEVGFDLYFVKPANPLVLLDAIVKWQASTSLSVAAPVA
jgi:signal transduction histidine kinase/DNA-binding response OmpR family regulator